MDTVFLNKNGSLIVNGNTVEADPPLKLLGSQILLEDTCTLRSYFLMLSRYPVFRQLNHFSPAQMEQYRESPDEGCLTDLFDHLEFGKTVEMIGYPGKPRMEIYTSLRGKKSAEISELESSYLGNILDMQLVLGRLKHVVFGDKVDIFEFETVYTLFEFMDGISWALSFHGKPMQCEIGR